VGNDENETPGKVVMKHCARIKKDGSVRKGKAGCSNVKVMRRKR